MMKIQEIDSNFITTDDKTEDVKYYKLPCFPFEIYGVYFESETGRFVRLNSVIAKKTSERVAILNSYTAGGRVRFSTDSDIVSLKVRYKNKSVLPHMTQIGTCGFVLCENDGEVSKYITTFVPGHFSNIESSDDNGFTITRKIKGGTKRYYTLYLPLYNDIEGLEIGFSPYAIVESGYEYKRISPIVYYGSSITQGGCASRPDLTYQAQIEKKNNIDFINFGFAGAAKAEEILVKFLSNIKCSVFVCDYDYNADDVEYLRATHFNIYKTFRAKQNNTPIVFLSNPDYYLFNESEERFKIIKKTYDYAKKNGDKNVYLINGKSFFKNEWSLCTVDGIHPNDIGFYKMANKVYSVLKTIFDKSNL